MDEIERILTRMGYRQMKENLFGKPVGYVIFTTEIIENEIIWKNRFKSNNEILLWESTTNSDISIESSFEFGF